MSLPGQEKEPHLNRALAEIGKAVAAAFLYMIERFFVLIAHTLTVILDLVSKLVALFVEIAVFLIEIVKSAVRAAKDGSIYIARMFLELIVISLNWCKSWIIHATPNRGKDAGGDKKTPTSSIDGKYEPSGPDRPFKSNPRQDDRAWNDPNIPDDIARAEDMEARAQKTGLRIEAMIKNDVARAINIAEKYDYYAKIGSVPGNGNEMVGSINFPRSNLRYSGEIRIAPGNVAPPRYEATGFGVLYNGSEIIYRGQMLGDLRHGFGVFSQPGERYEGHFLNDKYNGLGKLTRINYIYIGEFKDGYFNGIGVLEYNNNAADYTRHFGEFLHGVACGYGARMMFNGDFYKGLFEGGVEIKWRSSKIIT